MKLQAALITPLIHVKGYAAPETKAAAEQAKLLIQQAEERGETPEDPLMLFSVLYAFFGVNFVAFNGDVSRELAEQFSTLAQKQGTTVPLMIGHRLMGNSLLLTGDIPAAQAHYNQGLSLYDPSEHRAFATRFGVDISVAILGFRSLTLWLLGRPEQALTDASHALKNAYEIGQAAASMFAMNYTAWTHTLCGDCSKAISILDEHLALADQKDAPYWKAFGVSVKGCALLSIGNTSAAIYLLTSEMTALHSVAQRCFANSAKIRWPIPITMLV